MIDRTPWPAPDLTLLDSTGAQVSLSSLHERPLVLLFLRWLG